MGTIYKESGMWWFMTEAIELTRAMCEEAERRRNQTDAKAIPPVRRLHVLQLRQ